MYIDIKISKRPEMYETGNNLFSNSSSSCSNLLGISQEKKNKGKGKSRIETRKSNSVPIRRRNFGQKKVSLSEDIRIRSYSRQFSELYYKDELNMSSLREKRQEEEIIIHCLKPNATGGSFRKSTRDPISSSEEDNDSEDQSEQEEELELDIEEINEIIIKQVTDMDFEITFNLKSLLNEIFGTEKEITLERIESIFRLQSPDVTLGHYACFRVLMKYTNLC